MATIQDLMTPAQVAGLETAEVELDNQPMELYDPDTAINRATNDRIRFYGVDAPEAPKYTSLQDVEEAAKEGRTIKPGLTKNIFEPMYRATIADQINNQGYNIVEDTGESSYDRRLGVVKNLAGYEMQEDLTAAGILNPSKYNVEDAGIQAAWATSQFRQLTEGVNNTPAWKQAENLLKVATQPKLGQVQLSEFYTPLDQATLSKDPNDISTAFDYWWGTTKLAMDGIVAGTGYMDKEELKEKQKEFAESMPRNFVIDLRQIKTAEDAWDFTTNNIVAFGPDYAVLYAGGKGGAAIGSAFGPAGTIVGGFLGGLVGLGYNYLKTTGNVVGEQVEAGQNINFGAASVIGLAVTALDKLGATKIFAPQDMLTKEGREKVIQYVAKRDFKNLAPEAAMEAARKKVGKTQKELVKKVSKDISLTAGDFLTRKRVALNAIKGMARQGATEGLTEAAQETIQYLGVHGMPKNAKEWEEFSWRLANAGAAGGIVGGAFAIPSTMADYAGARRIQQNIEYDVQDAQDTANLTFEADRQTDGKDVEELLDNYRGPVQGTSIQDRAKEGKKNLMQRTFAKIARGEYFFGLSAIKNVTRKMLRQTNGDINLEGIILAQIEGAYNVLSGGNLYNTEVRKAAEIEQAFPWLNDPSELGDYDTASLNSLIDRFISDNYLYNDTYTDTEKNTINKIMSDLRTINQMINEMAPEDTTMDFGIDWRADEKHLLRAGLPDLRKIHNDPQKFVEALMNTESNVEMTNTRKGEKIHEKDARHIVDSLMQNSEFSTTVGLLNQMNLRSNLPEFFPTNTLENLKNTAVYEIRSITREFYRGANLEVYSNLINKMVDEGYITEERANELAADMLDQVAKHDGTYGRVETKRQGTIQEVEENLRTATTLGVMDASVFAQFGEVLYAFAGTNQPIVKNIAKFAMIFMRNASEDLGFKKIVGMKKSEDKTEYERYGYNEEELARQQNVNMSSKFRRNLLKYFFRINLLKPTTDTVRIARMALADSVFYELAMELKPLNGNYANMTQDQARAFERMKFYGINIDTYMKYLNVMDQYDDNADVDLEAIDPELADAMYKLRDNALPKFIDEMSVRIKPGSRQSLFEERRFGIPFFTMFMSFTSHFSGNILPRLYSVYMKEATTPVAFGTFKLLAGAILVAYMSQYLKDLLLKGELHPSLADWGDVQRGIEYSGSTGWAAEIFNRAVRGPYGHGGTIEDMLSSPPISHLSGVGEKIIEGEFGEAAEKGLPFGNVATGIYDRFKDKPEKTIQQIINGE